MKKILLEFADRSFLVDPDTAAKVQAAVPPDRFVTTTTIDQTPELPPLGQRKSSSVFERHQANLIEKEKQYAERFARHLSKLKRPQKMAPP